MRQLKKTVVACAFMLTVGLSGCTDQEPGSSNNSAAVGADRDAHGCIGSAGYQWCARTNRCERPWELAKKQGFENTPEGFTDHCEQ